MQMTSQHACALNFGPKTTHHFLLSKRACQGGFSILIGYHLLHPIFVPLILEQIIYPNVSNLPSPQGPAQTRGILQPNFLETFTKNHKN